MIGRNAGEVDRISKSESVDQTRALRTLGLDVNPSKPNNTGGFDRFDCV